MRSTGKRSAAAANHSIPPLQPWRGRLVYIGLLACAVVLAGRAFYLQVLNNDFLVAEGDKRMVRTLTVPGGRGAILDRHGRPLALSAPVESVWAVPEELLKASTEQIKQLAEVLGFSYKYVHERLTKYHDRSFVYLRRQMEPDQAQRAKKLGLPGLFLQREYRRFYPAAEATAQLVGITNIDMQGQEGMELALDSILRGKDGSRRVIKDRLGHVVEDLAQYVQPRPGADVRLSINLRLQYLTYRELKRAVTDNKADSGVAVVLDPETGEVLAMASVPSFNPNRRASISGGAMRERAITDVFEPGSTAKPFIVAAGLQSGKFTTDSLIDTNHGRWRIGSLLITDTHDNGIINLARLLMKSSNVGAAKVGTALGKETVWATYHRLGIGQPTGINFPGESTGVLHPASGWGDIATATNSYGYGFNVTALQLARAYCALATDGRLPELTLLRHAEGAPVPSIQAFVPKVARTVRHMLVGVVSPTGTARRAMLKDYTVAGKTGTAYQTSPEGGYYHNRYNTVFVGMVPADDPRLLAVIQVSNPQAGTHYGGTVAAPAFKRIMKAAVRMYRVMPDKPDITLANGHADGEPRT